MPSDKVIKSNWEKDMKNGQDYMKKASSMFLTKAPECDSVDDSMQLKVSLVVLFVFCFYFKFLLF